tara:strand:- start:273 stop:938 length:666 start_codon:yes stop_codon:yes gene_type:complete
MFNSDAGKALGLTDDEGKETGLFTWIADKVDEWIITPVMGFLEGIFVSIGEGIMSLGSGISGFMKRSVDNGLDDGWTKDTLYWMMGWSDKEPEGGHGEIKELREGKEQMAPGLSKLRKSDQDRIKKWGNLVGGKWSEQEYFDTLDKMSDEQIAEQLQLLKQRATRRGLDFNKVQETEELPTSEENNLPDYFDREGKIINQSNVSMTTVNNLAVLEPAAAHR